MGAGVRRSRGCVPEHHVPLTQPRVCLPRLPCVSCCLCRLHRPGHEYCEADPGHPLHWAFQPAVLPAAETDRCVLGALPGLSPSQGILRGGKGGARSWGRLHSVTLGGCRLRCLQIHNIPDCDPKIFLFNEG